MTFPPSVLRVRVQDSRRGIGLWIPLILVWPFLVAIAALLYPMIVVVAVILWRRGWGKPLLLSGPVIFGLFCALRGLEVDVRQHSGQVLVSFR